MITERFAVAVVGRGKFTVAFGVCLAVGDSSVVHSGIGGYAREL
jgi:hypothetical protein